MGPPTQCSLKEKGRRINDSGLSTSNAPTDNEVSTSHVGKNKSSFDFIQFCEE